MIQKIKETLDGEYEKVKQMYELTNDIDKVARQYDHVAADFTDPSVEGEISKRSKQEREEKAEKREKIIVYKVGVGDEVEHFTSVSERCF